VRILYWSRVFWRQIVSSHLISCIVPVHNGEAFLRETLDTIYGQTHRPLDVVVVDDGSTDGTRDLVENYPEPVRYVWQANAGPSSARNTDLQVAQGELVSFLDADDLWHPEKLTRQLALLQRRPELGACVTLIQNFWTDELRDERESFRGHPREQPLPGYTSVTLLARRSLFDAIGGFDTRLKHGDSTDWFLRAEEHGAAIELVPEVLVYRRVHPHSRSRRWQGRSRDEYVHLLKSHLDRRRALEGSSSDDELVARPNDAAS
jgi:glycosyltransferase involved in cell wall biosynthesis